MSLDDEQIAQALRQVSELLNDGGQIGSVNEGEFMLYDQARELVCSGDSLLNLVENYYQMEG